MPKKLTREIFIEKAEKIHNGLYDYSEVNYINNSTKIKIICRKEGHGVFEQRPYSHLCGDGCPKCIGKHKSNEDFVQEASTKHGDLYDYTLVKYISATTKIKIICRKEGHGVFEQQPNNHLQGQGCPKCAGTKQSNTDDFIKKAKIIHDDNYDYSLVKYINTRDKVKIICLKEGHGVFEQRPNSHLRGEGCIKCGGKEHSNTENIVQNAKTIHGDLYDYTLVDYINSKTKIKIICRKEGHGIFEQLPSDHFNEHGCPKCVGRNKTFIQFVQEAKLVHGDMYDYSLVDYINTITKVKIICKDHGEFMQTPFKHLQGCGCPKCTSKISLPEIIWLNINQIKPEFRQYKILKYTVDGYDPDTNTIFEFHGDYWHGNPNKFNANVINNIAKKTFGELYEKTIQREQEIKNAGYNLIVIWESEFIKQYAEQIKNYKSIHGAQKITECRSYN